MPIALSLSSMSALPVIFGMAAPLIQSDSAPHAVPSIFGMDATVWVSVAMAVLVGILLWKKTPALVVRGLDKQIAAIRLQLDEAEQVRGEAEALKADYETKIAAVEQEAAILLATAAEEAQRHIAKAESEAQALITRRERMAEDRIAAAKAQAVAEVRRAIVEVAGAAAAEVVAQKHDKVMDKPLVNRTIMNI